MPDTRIVISTNPARLDRRWVCAMLRGSYWGDWLNDAQILASLPHSLCFGAYAISRTLPKPKQVGFVRVVTDYAMFSSVTDVVVDPEWREQGIGSKLMAAVSEHPAIAGTISILATRHAATLYERFGWRSTTQRILKRNPTI